MTSSYREDLAKFKYEKAVPIEDSPVLGKRAKKKKTKRADHKHEYIPVIFHGKQWIDHGFICKHCGRVQDVIFDWHSFTNNKFREQYQNCLEIELPDDWDISDKYIPLPENIDEILGQHNA